MQTEKIFYPFPRSPALTDLPEDSLVLLLEVDKGVGGLAVPQVGKASLAPKAKVVADDLGAPASPHVVVAANGLPLSHQAEVHGRPNKLTLKGEVHAAHGVQDSLTMREEV